eukprot:scaffold9350_cov62-Phaeocystis_antarctica.AAC.1
MRAATSVAHRPPVAASIRAVRLTSACSCECEGHLELGRRRGQPEQPAAVLPVRHEQRVDVNDGLRVLRLHQGELRHGLLPGEAVLTVLSAPVGQASLVQPRCEGRRLAGLVRVDLGWRQQRRSRNPIGPAEVRPLHQLGHGHLAVLARVAVFHRHRHQTAEVGPHLQTPRAAAVEANDATRRVALEARGWIARAAGLRENPQEHFGFDAVEHRVAVPLPHSTLHRVEHDLRVSGPRRAAFEDSVLERAEVERAIRQAEERACKPVLA